MGLAVKNENDKRRFWALLHGAKIKDTSEWVKAPKLTDDQERERKSVFAEMVNENKGALAKKHGRK